MFKKINKENITFIIIIFLLSIIFLHNIVSTSKIMGNIHHINDVTFISQNLKESLYEFGQLHLWTPYYYSGRPLYAQPEYYLFDFNFIYLFLFRNIFIAMNLATITYFFLSGLGMYLLFLTFKDNKKAAFIAAIIYMFNGYMHSFVIGGNLNVLTGYAMIPFALMFFVKALQSKNFVQNAIFSGLIIALQLFSGGTLLIPYEIVLFGIYSIIYLFGKNTRTRALKIVYVGIIVILVSFGVSAIKLLPGIEFMSLSNRGAGLSYQEYLGEPIQLSNIIHVVVTNLISNGISASVGVMGFILLIFSLYNYKKRYVMFSVVLLIFSILMSVKGPIADLFFKFPVFSQLRHIERAIVLIAISSSILAGTGFIIFSEKVKNVIKTNKSTIIFSGVVILILIELLFLQHFPTSKNIIIPNDIEVNDFISKDTGRFRTINLALSTLVGASGYNHLAQIGIGTIKGGSGIWFNEYLSYLSVAQQTNPAKLWGMLNNKYVISDRELNFPNLLFIDKFELCKECTIWEASGPYLYENLKFMPRAYFVDKSILVIGNEQDAQQVTYSLMLNDNFDPKSVVLISGRGSVDKYNLKELRNYDAIVLTKSIDSNELIILRNFIDNDGIVLPDIINNKNIIDQDDIKNLFENLNGKFEEIEIVEYENNKVIYNAKGKKGFLVLSERFSNFPGWEALGKNSKEILRANIITTAVFVDDDFLITFKYKPKSFRNGSLISLIALSLVILVFVYFHIKVRGDKNKT